MVQILSKLMILTQNQINFKKKLKGEIVMLISRKQLKIKKI